MRSKELGACNNLARDRKKGKALRVHFVKRAVKEDEVNRKMELLFTKVGGLCEKVNSSESSQKRKTSACSSVNVPRQ